MDATRRKGRQGENEYFDSILILSSLIGLIFVIVIEYDKFHTFLAGRSSFYLNHEEEKIHPTSVPVPKLKMQFKGSSALIFCCYIVPFLSFLLGGVLADEMGLGKTVTGAFLSFSLLLLIPSHLFS